MIGKFFCRIVKSSSDSPINQSEPGKRTRRPAAGAKARVMQQSTHENQPPGHFHGQQVESRPKTGFDQSSVD